MNLPLPVRCHVTNKTSLLFAWLIVSTMPILYFATVAVDSVQNALLGPTRVHVGDLGSLSLAAAPATMLYDRAKGDLVYLGSVDDDTKRRLVSVVQEVPDEQKAAKDRYLAAVNELAFEASQNQGRLTLLLLMLGGVAGALGVQLRSMTNYVGHACFKNDLDVVRWWPYYGIRPLTGFLLGITIIAIVQAGFLPLQSSATQRVLWWAALAFLAGFGEEEFTQRLRSVSKTIFGENHISNSEPREAAPSSQVPNTPSSQAPNKGE